MKLGIIGGSGLYDIEGLTNKRYQELDTPFGKPSGPYLLGQLNQVELVFLPRHGPGHVLTPSEVNYRANIHGFRQLGVRQLISVSAVGSLKEEIVPGHMVLPDQFFDRTKDRQATFFGQGVVVHVSFGDPICPALRQSLANVLQQQNIPYHDQATYVCMEGPVFSTRAESNFYRQLGADVIGMTALPEAKLAREAEMCYAVLALSTDYDCWHQTEEHVSVEAVLQVIKNNIKTARQTIQTLAQQGITNVACQCQQALQGAMLTAPDTISSENKERLGLLAGHLFAD